MCWPNEKTEKYSCDQQYLDLGFKTLFITAHKLSKSDVLLIVVTVKHNTVNATKPLALIQNAQLNMDNLKGIKVSRAELTGGLNSPSKLYSSWGFL